MKNYKSEQIRNIATGAHGGAGKTSIVEAILFNLGETNRIGLIEQGTTISDYNEDEIERQISISSSQLHGDWKDHKINLIDTPGYPDFFGEVVGGFTAVDSVMVVISASGGIEVGTEQVWEEAEKIVEPERKALEQRENTEIDWINFEKGKTKLVREIAGNNYEGEGCSCKKYP